MTLYSIESKVVALKKETERGTAEASPSKYIAVDKSSEFDYVPALIEDEQLRGLKDRIQPMQGQKTGTGKIKAAIEPLNCGELIYSLLGSVNSVKVSTTLAYKHTFTRSANLQYPSYTFWASRGLGVKKYNLCVVKKIAFAGGPDGKATMDCDLLFKAEAADGSLTPSWTAPAPFMFHQTDVKIAGSSNTDVKSWAINIDNQAFGLRVLDQKKDVNDIICPNKLLIDGSFEIYFQNETERAKFLANTASKIQIILTGALIEETFYHKLDITVYEIHYTAYPFGELDGLLGAAVSFGGYYSISDSKSVQIELTNTETTF